MYTTLFTSRRHRIHSSLSSSNKQRGYIDTAHTSNLNSIRSNSLPGTKAEINTYPIVTEEMMVNMRANDRMNVLSVLNISTSDLLQYSHIQNQTRAYIQSER